MRKENFDEEVFRQESQKTQLSFLCGVDEVGRGPLAGPVVSCSVIVTTGLKNGEAFFEGLKYFGDLLGDLGVQDSKKISSESRLKILHSLGFDLATLEENHTLEIAAPQGQGFLVMAISSATPIEIDQINILQASLLSMRRSLHVAWGTLMEKKLFKNSPVAKGLVLVDGQHKIPQLTDKNFHQIPVIKGDARSRIIGLSSIIAKEFRDHYMKKMDSLYPGYGWEGNAGYPTIGHREQIALLGPSPIHRKTFKGVKEYVASPK